MEKLEIRKKSRKVVKQERQGMEYARWEEDFVAVGGHFIFACTLSGEGRDGSPEFDSGIRHFD